MYAPRLALSLLCLAILCRIGAIRHHSNASRSMRSYSFALRRLAYQSQAAAEISWDMQYRCQSRLSNSAAFQCDAIPWLFHSMRFHAVADPFFAVAEGFYAIPTLSGSKPYQSLSLPCRRMSCLSTTTPLRPQAIPWRFHTAPCLRPVLRILSASVPSHAVPFPCFSLPFLCVSLASLCDSHAPPVQASPPQVGSKPLLVTKA